VMTRLPGGVVGIGSVFFDNSVVSRTSNTHPRGVKVNFSRFTLIARKEGEWQSPLQYQLKTASPGVSRAGSCQRTLTEYNMGGLESVIAS